jgi:signal transduction histidine kinase
MSRLTLRGRVTLASMVVLGVALAVLGIAINVLLTGRLGADASSVLRDRASAQLATLAVDGGRIRTREGSNDGALDQHSWVFAGGRALERAPASATVQRAARSLGGSTQTAERAVDERVRLRAQPIYAERGRRRVGTIVVAVSLLPYEHVERIARLGTLALVLFVLAAGTLVARRAVGSALRPVAEMTDRAADWSEHDLHRRFELGPPRDELGRLAATLDALLGRIEAALRHEQRFSAEMAHELRTPLAGVRAEAELALRDSPNERELHAAMERVLTGTDRMAAAIDTLMTAARSDADGGSPGSCDPSRPVAAVVQAMRPVAEAHGIGMEMKTQAGNITVGADADLVAQAVQPLLENALRHARSAVQVVVLKEDGQVHIAVGDDGPGVAEESAEAIFEPGASTVGGAGLGLPLARRLARACGGELVLVPGNGGGRLELRLPGTALDRARRP